jgi:hypothetical protein
MLSTKGQIVFGVPLVLSALCLLYFNFLGQGPMQWVAGWIADSQGRYSVMLAFWLALFPFVVVFGGIGILFDRLTSRSRDFE